VSISLLNIDRFSQFFHRRIGLLSWNCAMKLLIKIPPHLRCVATLPCEMFRHDSAPAHRARETIKLLQRETPAFIVIVIYLLSTIIKSIIKQHAQIMSWTARQQCCTYNCPPTNYKKKRIKPTRQLSV